MTKAMTERILHGKRCGWDMLEMRRATGFKVAEAVIQQVWDAHPRVICFLDKPAAVRALAYPHGGA